ncbi:MAG: U32 family peptidase [Oscillospiraceae bacterium]|nr:U32 family peptidase [Oscillospiraceae bacterium]
MLELLSPAGSPEGVIAAVQNGADGIYLRIGGFVFNDKASNFTQDEFGRAIEYCRVRGVKTYLALNTAAFDNELSDIARLAIEACRNGIDGIIVQEPGVMLAVRRTVPEVSLHAGMGFGIHNLEGVRMAAAMGFKRATLARELSRKKIAYICKHAPIDIEVFAHGAQCVSYTGQCYMSTFTSGKSDNRGMCTEPCRLNYNAVGHGTRYPLSLKDNCLISYIDDLDGLGVKAINIEGLTQRPEYSAMVTGSYSKVVHNRRFPSQDDLRTLQTVFSKQGFTDGYYTEQQDGDMLGMRDVEERDDSVIFETARKNYLNGEYQRIPVRFVGTVNKDKRVKLEAIDDKNNSAILYGPVPEQAFHKELTLTTIQTQLHKTFGTPFQCISVKGTVDPGLALPLAVWDDMRRKLLAEILEQRRVVEKRTIGEYVSSEYRPGHDEPPILSVYISSVEQLSSEMLELAPPIVYIPVMELYNETSAFREMLDNKDITVVAALPRVIHDSERNKVSDMLYRALALGVSEALVSNIGHIQFARSHGLDIRGDYGLNVYNGETLAALSSLGLKSATLSFELSLAQIGDISKPIDTEILSYGRIPMMIMQTCITKIATGACTCDSFSGLVDEQGAVLPVLPEFGCRNTLFSSKKLFLADRQRAVSALGLWAQRLMFTTENALECVAVLKRYMGLNDYTPSGYMRGVYYTGVE